jgi:CheY-like chemotaxis protein
VIPGRTLLLADDSVAIQKVIDLTFTDEGMQVITTGDGQDALEKLNQTKPDVVLADIFMPGVDGYELCKFIKQSEQFRGVPVMLLVGSFEPFDEAQAKRAGADDVVTKPFQSIRDLVSRVGSLVNRTPPNVETESEEDDDSTFAVETSSADELAGDHYAAPATDQERVTVSEAEQVDQAAPRVFVEAALMETPEMVAEPEHACPPDIDLQTADTQQLTPVTTGEDSEMVEVEIVPEAQGSEAVESGEVVAVGEFQPDQLVGEEMEAAPAFDDDGVLDLGDVDSFAGSDVADDFELDVDVAPLQFSSAPTESVDEAVPVQMAHHYEAALETAPVPHEPTISEPSSALEQMTEPSKGDLSPAAIEAISRRVVEQLSDKVVREIAWEVVPELSELLIKKRLDQR